MCARALICIALCGVLTAAKKPLPPTDGMAGNEDVSIHATLYADPAAVEELLGSNLDGHYIVVKVEVKPNKKYTIDHDNFLLRTDKDGERAHPYEPTQIAGDGALVVTTTDDKDGSNNRRSSGGFGGSPGMVQSAKPLSVSMQEGTGKKTPILATLQTRLLPQKAVDEPVTGLLYFPMEKQRSKDLELIVTTPTGKLDIRFSK
jgi:hypothetical protein